MEVKDKFQAVTSTRAMAAVVQEILENQHPFDQQKEQFFVLGLNTKHILRYVDLVTMGTLDATLVHPREVFRHAVTHGVACLALAHNHPSGQLTPSREDDQVTRRLAEVGKALGITVLDHMIVGGNTSDYFSYAEDRSWIIA